MKHSPASRFVLSYRPLVEGGRGYAFPCDRLGKVEMDRLSESARNDYIYARAVVGRELAEPAVERCEMA